MGRNRKRVVLALVERAKFSTCVKKKKQQEWTLFISKIKLSVPRGSYPKDGLSPGWDGVCNLQRKHCIVLHCALRFHWLPED